MRNQYGMAALPNEVWLPLKGYEDCYSISNRGRVILLKRPVKAFMSKWGKPIEREYSSKLLKTHYVAGGKQVRVNILPNDGGKRQSIVLALLMLTTFKPEGMLPGLKVCFKDGNPSNTDLDNLYWGIPPKKSNPHKHEPKPGIKKPGVSCTNCQRYPCMGIQSKPNATDYAKLGCKQYKQNTKTNG